MTRPYCDPLITGGAGSAEKAAGAVAGGRESRAVPGSRGLRTAAVPLLSLGGGKECRAACVVCSCV